VRLNELTNPEKWRHPAWMAVHTELETYAIDKHCFSRTKEFAYRKGWEWTQAAFGLDLLGAVRPDARCLGVGAGREPLLFYFADRVGMVVGTDLYGNELWSTVHGAEANAAVLRDAAQYCPRPYARSKLCFGVMSGTHLGFRTSTFDFVWSLSSIEHFGGHERAAEAVREMARVTRPGGTVAVATELILTPDPPGHPEFFTREAFERYVVRASPDLVPVQEMSYDLPALEYLIDPIMVHLGEDVHRRRHHIVLNDGTVQWTSVMVFLQKKA
jgi:SAM-dependent methyltransferase